MVGRVMCGTQYPFTGGFMLEQSTMGNEGDYALQTLISTLLHMPLWLPQIHYFIFIHPCQLAKCSSDKAGSRSDTRCYALSSASIVYSTQSKMVAAIYVIWISVRVEGRGRATQHKVCSALTFPSPEHDIQSRVLWRACAECIP